MKIEFDLVDLESECNTCFEVIKCFCNGMMTSEIYRKIFSLCKNIDSGSVLELGTAGGGSIISAGLGLKAGGKNLKAYSIDKFISGSWGEDLDSDVNYQTVSNRLSTFDVSGFVTLIKARLDNFSEYKSSLNSVSFLIIDADGKIHRDLFNLMTLCRDRTLLLIDDYQQLVRLNQHKNMSWTVCWKKIKTWDVVNQLIEFNVIEKIELLDGAFLGYFFPKKLTHEVLLKINSIYMEVEKTPLNLTNLRINFNRNCYPNNVSPLFFENSYENFFEEIKNSLKKNNIMPDIRFIGEPIVRWSSNGS